MTYAVALRLGQISRYTSAKATTDKQHTETVLAICEQKREKTGYMTFGDGLIHRTVNEANAVAQYKLLCSLIFLFMLVFARNQKASVAVFFLVVSSFCTAAATKTVFR